MEPHRQACGTAFYAHTGDILSKEHSPTAKAVALCVEGWNQYLWPLIVTNSDEMRVVQIGIKMPLAGEEQAAEWNVIMAGTIIAMVPPLIILFVMQSSLVKGFSMGEEK